MDIFKFIDGCTTQKQLPYVRLITVYIDHGVVTNVCLCRYADKKIAKKAAKVGLTVDRMMTEIGKGTKIANFSGYNVQDNNYYLNYCTSNKNLDIYLQ